VALGARRGGGGGRGGRRAALGPAGAAARLAGGRGGPGRRGGGVWALGRGRRGLGSADRGPGGGLGVSALGPGGGHGRWGRWPAEQGVGLDEIGRASCRERVENSEVAASLLKTMARSERRASARCELRNQHT